MYYPYSENKGADQLRSYREADLRLCFSICKMLVFSRRGSYINYIPDKYSGSVGYKLVRGTHLHQSEDYRNNNGMFQCIHSKVSSSLHTCITKSFIMAVKTDNFSDFCLKKLSAGTQ